MMNQNEIKRMGSYPDEDVTFLLKNLNGLMKEDDLAYRERAIQSGVHYSEMLPIEYEPSADYMKLFYESLQDYKQEVAIAVGAVAEQLLEKWGGAFTIVSLARAGTPIGILVKRYLRDVHHIDVPHYSVSIIRDRGLDEQAIHHILEREGNNSIQFVDGWTGKGAITKELERSCRRFKEEQGIELDDSLAVLADPGHCSDLFGTREDYLIPSACLNATVSGLVSRTVLNEQYIAEDEFHGAKYYEHLEAEDVSNEFVDTITEQFSSVGDAVKYRLQEVRQQSRADWAGWNEIEEIQKQFNIEDVNHIKPGVGETTRVLLRRVPWKILVKDKQSPYLHHVFQLAEEKGVPIEEYRGMSYSCCGLIKKV
ncbi:cysteine protease StiP family protein [Pontibacillus halophilus]|uniref:cysteine protease StiP family protein n=1 Tax=Pontibacillus halophilus TaxID=516704 RepID=UPI00040C7A70|nr:cysteine protease StiP family protein [Pontibacillus halophilus]